MSKLKHCLTKLEFHLFQIELIMFFFSHKIKITRKIYYVENYPISFLTQCTVGLLSIGECQRLSQKHFIKDDTKKNYSNLIEIFCFIKVKAFNRHLGNPS